MLKRLLMLGVLLWGITLISFLVIRLAPGSPIDVSADLNPKMTAAAKERLKALYELDKPLLEQYSLWMSRVIRLDFGASFQDGKPVTRKIAEAIPVTLLVQGLSLFLVFLAGIPCGILAATRPNSALSKCVHGVAFFGFSMPQFWLAMLLMSALGVHLGWLPVSGLTSISYERLSVWGKIADVSAHLIMPVCVAAISGLAVVSRFTESSVREQMREDYVRTAYAKGLSERRVLYGHVLRNALLPVITLIGLSVPSLLGGSVVLETVFSIPGMGRLFFNAVFARDYPVVMGILVMGSFLTLLGNGAADLAYRLADPRVRRQ